MRLSQFFSFFSGRPEKFIQRGRVKNSNLRSAVLPTVRDIFHVMPEKSEIQVKRAVGLQSNDLLHLVQEFGFAIGGQAHDLVFVPVKRKTEPLSQCGIKNTQRVREINSAVDLDLPASRQTPRRAREITEPIHRHGHRFREWRNEMSRS